jgi:hypothetical protein
MVDIGLLRSLCPGILLPYEIDDRYSKGPGSEEWNELRK